MKKTLMVVAMTTLFGCSKDDNQANVQSTILGKWFYKEQIVNGVTFPYDDHETCGKDYIEFSNNNSIKGIDVWNCKEDIEWVGTYLKVNNSLTITNGDNNLTVEITELTAKSLVYKYTSDENGDGILENYIEKFDR